MVFAFAATGIYAWQLFRDNLRIPTFCYVWATSAVILLSGAVDHALTGTRAFYVGGHGGTHWLTWAEYGDAELAAAVGTICIALGHYWANRRQWSLALPEFIDSRAPDSEHLRRWAFFLLLAGFVPLMATGILNPVTLIRVLFHGRDVHGNARYLYSQGTYFAFFGVFGDLVPFGIVATAILFWGRGRPRVLLAITAFLVAVTLLTGTRSLTAAALAPFVVLPRYMGNARLFRRLAVLAVAGGFVLFTVQLVYRATGFQHAQLGYALTHANPISTLDGFELDWTGEAMRNYGHAFPYLNGQSFYAVIASPVPRVFWHDKPDGYGTPNATNLGYPAGETMSSAWIGEAYANFGWFGIPIVGLIAGGLMGILDVFIRRSGAFAMAVFIPLQFHWAFWVRGDAVFALDTWFLGFILLFLALAVLGPARKADSGFTFSEIGDAI